MAGDQYVYAEGDAVWIDTFLARAEKTAHGMNGIILTNYTTSAVCTIAAGSVVEIDGAMYHFASETAITGAVSTGMMYIICSVTGTTASPYWDTNIFSTYDTAKAGLYTGASRYVAECHYGHLSTEYEGKYVYPERTRDLRRKIPIGSWNMDTVVTKNVDHGLDWTTIWGATALIRGDSGGGINDMLACDGTTAAAGGKVSFTATVVNLSRATSGHFDGAGYNTLTYNRGMIMIWYEI